MVLNGRGVGGVGGKYPRQGAPAMRPRRGRRASRHRVPEWGCRGEDDGGVGWRRDGWTRLPRPRHGRSPPAPGPLAALLRRRGAARGARGPRAGDPLHGHRGRAVPPGRPGEQAPLRTLAALRRSGLPAPAPRGWGRLRPRRGGVHLGAAGPRGVVPGDPDRGPRGQRHPGDGQQALRAGRPPRPPDLRGQPAADPGRRAQERWGAPLAPR